MDVAIVGAGPAGAWAALRLARQGARVTLFDPAHPREKPCGGGVTGRALAHVEAALPPATLRASVIDCVRFTDSRRRQTATVRLDRESVRPGIDAHAPIPPLIVASRLDLDGALLDAAIAAGAEFVRSRVTHISIAPNGVSIETTAGTFQSGFVIGADGANSLVRRRVARPFGRHEISIATGFFARGLTSTEIVIEFVDDPPGYIWSFPRPDHLAIGICAQGDAGYPVGALRAQTADWIRRCGIAGDAPLDAYSWPIPSLDVHGLRRLELAGPRWCLVGDAAGLVDPITREGIYFALRSGEWAADAVAHSHAHSTYAEQVRAEIVPELMRAARLKAGFFRPSFIGLLMHALRVSEPVRSVMADLVAGRQEYRGLKARLLRTFEWRLGWQLLAGVWQSEARGDASH